MDVSAIQAVASQISGTKAVQAEMSIRTLDKANDLTKQQGEAMINMIESSVDSSKGKINAVA